MSDQKSIIKTFKVIHADFYEEFTKWSKEVKNENNPSEGVYTLATNSPIKKLQGIDPQGILYIGKGDIFSNQTRIGQFINSINGTSDYHDAGVRYRELKELYPLDSLALNVELFESSRKIESERLDAFKKEFGELPLLNLIS